MGITDGHLFLDSNIYYQGMRPAVNIPLSVTRVGRQTLDNLSRDINKTLTAFLGQYNKLQNLSHFGQELTPEVKKKLRIGDMIYKFFTQSYHETVPSKVQLVILSLLLQDLIESKEILEKVKTKLINLYVDPDGKNWIMEMNKAHDLKGLNEIIMNNKDKLLALAG